MLLTITYTGQNTTDLGYLLYKNPARPQVVELNYGKAYVFYPEASNERTTVALLLDIDPIDLARGKVGSSGGGLFDYVNDRPYVSSSFLSTAISKVFGTAMTGRADAHQSLSDSAMDLTATVTMLPCRGEHEKLESVFEPLGYEVTYETFVSDESFPNWGESKYVNLTISGKVRLRDLLKHLYVLIPVFDRQKHYWVGADEVEKLLRIGEDWLPNHPEKGFITGRYLNRRRALVNLAFERLAESSEGDGESPGAPLDDGETREPSPSLAGASMNDGETGEPSPSLRASPNDGETIEPSPCLGASPNDGETIEPSPCLSETGEPSPGLEAFPRLGGMSLNERRLGCVLGALKSCGARRVIDIGCGEGRLLSLLVKDAQFTCIAGVDVSHVALEHAKSRLKLERAGDYLRERVNLFQGSLMYKDARFEGYDAACVVEVVEHLDIPRLAAF